MPYSENTAPEAIRIERLNPENYNIFTGLIEKLAEYEKLMPPDEDAILRLKEDAFSANPRYEAYIGYVNEIPAGYITFYFTYSTFTAKSTLYLEDIFVLEEWRNHGLGRSLFEFCRNTAKTRGCGRMDWTVLTWNEPSITFYEKQGGKRQDWYLYRLEGDEI
ncbi:MAG: GNAT family N-acetyltransferase [Methanomicrobiaceae archaeon]|nr:GNAT family N-acetyltransferase [Methanomicrobiaceae archaeon]